MMKTGFLTFLSLLVLPSFAFADWPGFRGPTGDGQVHTQGIPIHWSASENVLWRTELAGQGWSSPIVVDDSIYLTAAIQADGAAEKPDYELSILILDGQTGTLQKRVPLFTQSGFTAPRIHKKNSHASPTPVSDGEKVFVHFGHQGTACIDLKGNILWRNDSLGYSPVHGSGGSPIVFGELLIFARDGKAISEVTALDQSTGEIVWRRKRDVETSSTFSFCTPLVLTLDGETQIIVPGSNVVQSLEPTTGREIWRVRYDGYSVIPKPIFESGRVFVSTSYDRPSLLAIDPTGGGDVTESHVRWQTKSAAIPHTPSLVALAGKVAMVSDKGISVCYDAKTGEELWKERVGGNYSASPLLVGSLMYLLSEGGECTILDISGQPNRVAKNQLKERTLASPAVIDHDLLIRSAEALYRIGTR